MIHLYVSFFKKEKRDPDCSIGRAPGSQAGRLLLENGLRELYDMPYDEDMLDTGENGKPFLKGCPEICFNISHTEGLAVCAFADGPVGVDAEAVRPVRGPLVRRVLHEEEQRILNRYRDGVVLENGKEVSVFRNPENEKKYDTVFFRYWTLKESYLKWDGCGLTREPREIRFDLDPEDWESPVFCSDAQVICRQYRLQDNEEEPEQYILSVCTGRSESPLNQGGVVFNKNDSYGMPG